MIRAAWKNIKFYILYVIVLLGFYTWATAQGISYYGDDNIRQNAGKSQAGYGGHGYYYHK